MASTIPHLLVDKNGKIQTAASFAPTVRWQPGDVIDLGLGMRYRVLERRKEAETVTLVVERA